MQIYNLNGNTVDIVSVRSRDIQKGDYIIITDELLNRSLIAQVTNIVYANIPGVLEDILRDSLTKNIGGQDLDFLNMKSFVDIIQDAKIFRCRIRRAIVNGKICYDMSWTPSRSTSHLIKVEEKDLIELIGLSQENSITLGRMKSGTKVSIALSSIDGKLNIITGKKGTGKSHISKLFVLSLIQKGGICIVFDINGEYINLGYKENNEKGSIYEKIHVLVPGKNFKVTLEDAGLGVFLNILSSILDLPVNSAWEIRRIWSYLSTEKILSMSTLREAINSVSNNYVKDALIRRYEVLANTGLFTDNLNEASTLVDIFLKLRNGGAVIVNLKGLSSNLRQIIVEFMLSKLCYLLEQWVLRAIFLFAEEAHLYLKKTYWEDIVTRMRHLGIFSTFITNQPDSISESIYRQADNIFLFNFTNENDLSCVSKATMVDVETVSVIARELPPHHCLILGKASNDFPIIVKIKTLRVKKMGQTRYFFQRW